MANRFRLAIVFFTLTLVNCAQLHHVQIGEVDSHPNFSRQKFDIKISETGINLQEATHIAKAVLNKSQGAAVEKVAGIVGLFQQGPRTGNAVFVKDYAKDLMKLIYQKCPSGNVTGLMSIRESRKYPVISGEIVHITGYCLVRKEKAS